MAAKFEVYSSGSQYRWRLTASNGEIASGRGLRHESRGKGRLRSR
jgi:uncharacterized protein YegP (UPF0339 family)